MKKHIVGYNIIVKVSILFSRLRNNKAAEETSGDVVVTSYLFEYDENRFVKSTDFVFNFTNEISNMYTGATSIFHMGHFSEIGPLANKIVPVNVSKKANWYEYYEKKNCCSENLPPGYVRLTPPR